MRLFVGNLSYNTAESAIQTMFEQFGTVDEVFLARDRETGRSRGFAFVTMNNDDEARAAIEGTNGQQLEGRPLKVNEAQPREERGPRGGGGGYGGGGGGGRGGYGGGGGGGGRGGYGGGGGGRDRGDRGGYDRGKRDRY
jgi:RNA recognition motif-containing protein